MTAVSAGGAIKVEWRRNVNDPATAFSKQSYRYSKGNTYDVFLVDINHPSAAPSNVSGSGSGTVLTRNKFRVGDKVCLQDHVLGSSRVTSKPHLKEASASISVIVDVSAKEHQYQNTAGQPINDFTVSVMSLKSGDFFEFFMDDLRYADGSLPGAPRASHVNPFGVPGSANAGASRVTFVAGDRVMLLPHCKDLRGCLYLPRLNFVGTVTSASSSRVSVKCYDCQNNPAWQTILNGNFPHYTYEAKDLVLEGDTSFELHPLVCGDIVTLDDSFAEASGWCLGSAADKQAGLVRFAPAAAEVGSEQRDVLVSSLDDTKKVYSFRGKWLKRVKAEGPARFKIGDRVKLDIGTARKGGKETSGKCLGLATQGNYGRVCGLGVLRDGVQRNVEVVSASGGRAGTVSLYPSYSLMLAPRLAVLLDDEVASLVQNVSQVLRDADMPEIDAELETRRLGLDVWSFLGTLPNIGKEKIYAAWHDWDETRFPSWSANEPDVTKFGYGPAPKDSAGEILLWQCSNVNCRIPGGYARNDIKSPKCTLCKAPAPRWTCEFCSTKNKMNTDCCTTCFENKAQSTELAQIKLLEKAETDRAALAEMECLQLQKAAAVQETHMEQLYQIQRERESLVFAAGGSRVHPGSFQACGGNPAGRVRCLGQGICSTGLDSCTQCGRGTHWTCCASTDRESLCCPASVLRKISKRNALILFQASTSSATEEVNQIRGYSPIVPITTWACEACTTINDKSRTDCEVCGGSRPKVDAESYDSIWAGMQDVSDDEEDMGDGASRLGTPQPNGAPDSGSAETAECDSKAGLSPSFTSFASNIKIGGGGPAAFIFGSAGGTVAGGNTSGGLFGGGFVSPPLAPLDQLAGQQPTKGPTVTCSVGHSMTAVKPELYLGKCVGRSPRCVKRPVHYHCFECKARVEDMCRPCYKFVLKQKAKLQEEGFRGARVSSPLARLAKAADAELRNAKAEKDAQRTIFSSGASALLKRVSVPLNTTINVYSEPLGAFGAFGRAAPKKIASLPAGSIFTINPNTLNVSGNLVNAQLADGSGWVTVRDGDNDLVVEEPGEDDEESSGDNDDNDDDNDSQNGSQQGSDDENHVEYYDEASESGSIVQASSKVPEDFEAKKNAATAEQIFMKEMHTNEVHTNEHHPPAQIGPPLSSERDTGSPASRRTQLLRQNSSGFFQLAFYEEIEEIEDLLRFSDKTGNTAAHYAVSLGLKMTYAALLAHGADAWKRNATFDTPAGLKYLPLKSGEASNTLFTHLAIRSMVPEAAILPALRCGRDYTPPAAMQPLVGAIKDGQEDDAAFFAEEVVVGKAPHALLYRAVFRLEFDYGPMLARQDLEQYMSGLCSAAEAGDGSVILDPLYLYAVYLLWKKAPGGRPSHNKVDRLRAFDAICALKCFPAMCALWLDPREKHDEDMATAGDTHVVLAELEEDDYSDLLPPPGYHDPESVWERAKVDHGLVSPSMDKLMAMTGLKRVKETALTVALNVLLKPPPDLKTGTSMNFLFLGNPGSGKTSVAMYLGQAMAELKYRQNDTPVFTDAGEILGAQNPLQEFSRLVKEAEGWSDAFTLSLFPVPNPDPNLKPNRIASLSCPPTHLK